MRISDWSSDVCSSDLLGTPGTQGAGTGWITRAWNSQPGAPGNVTMPALAVNSRTPANLLGATQSLTMGSPSDFELNSGAWAWQPTRDDSPAGLKGVNQRSEARREGKEGFDT